MPPATPEESAARVAEREWPPLRARIVDLAAALDRLDRAGDAAPIRAVHDEAARLIAILLDNESTGRAERVLGSMSRPYDPRWRARFAAGETAID